MSPLQRLSRRSFVIYERLHCLQISFRLYWAWMELFSRGEATIEAVVSDVSFQAMVKLIC
jgi:hypothetical protein